MKNIQLAILSVFSWLIMIVSYLFVLLCILITLTANIIPPFRILQHIAIRIYSAIYFVYEQIENAKMFLKQ